MEFESGSEWFRVPKTSFQEYFLVNDAVTASTKYKNKCTVRIFAEWQSLREVKVRVLVCGGLFKDYDLPKVTVLSADCRNGRSVAELRIVKIRDGGS